ncbi:hypothetical protein JRO89_XS13G0137400 [Xanthoceras sorbifolium]|uniref:Uncharacterized protein n=1 Tax=Xanthoceras sorbifolium TaxID=99658 RepID=A0ABQ8H898_9ROSI|nr:hypothetical protein JRO89_XS13G0137400 [Xanthoceras sorbifolium]
MGRAPCCSKVGLNRGSWTDKEDALLTNYIQHHGEGHWRHLPKNAETAKEEPEKTKIYLPKAIRVSPYYLLTIRNSSFDSTIESATSSSWFGLKEANDHAVRGQTTSDFEGIIISDHACDISSLDFSKLFEEYEQLLKSEDQPSQV